MTLSIYEPPPLEIKITLALGLTVLSSYYRGFARSLRERPPAALSSPRTTPYTLFPLFPR
ncbi:MAG: hypothetical protein PHS96_07165 [Anaerolineales bacterium]|nr:hypothetical protein [Anaerolineales bacterium]